MDCQRIGQQGERLAERYLKQQGLRLIERNSRYRSGEIDLVMLDRRTLVFVEVRLRKHFQYGSAAETVDIKKQRKLTKAAGLWLSHNSRFSNADCRFDVLAIDTSTESAEYLWYKDAFRPE